MNRTSPPVGVHASPTATPGRRVRSAGNFRIRPVSRRAQRFLHHRRGDLDHPPHAPSAYRRATASGKPCRSRAQGYATPASRVYRRTMNRTSRRRETPAGFSSRPFSVLCRGISDTGMRCRDLLLLRVTLQLDHFHPVAQSPWNRIEHVRRSDEQNAREIERNIQVVIAERRVLLRIEHFEQRRSRIAPEIAAQLVHLIQHEHRVVRARAPQRLDHLPRHRSDVRTAMPADLRLIVHAAQRNPLELAPQRTRDRAAQRRLPHSRRSDETKDRPLQLQGFELHHREEIENPGS